MLALDVDSIVQKHETKIAKIQEEIRKRTLFYEKTLEQVLE